MTRSRAVIRRGVYRDSIELLRMTLELEALAGVEQASIMMGTPPNLALLGEAGLLLDEAAAAGPNDLIVVVRADTELTLDAAFERAEALLRPAEERAGEAAPRRPRSIAQAAAREPRADLLLVSTPGPYAAAEALKGLQHGMDVFLFSDNVLLEQEIAIKRYADARGLLVMGPDCGTAMLGGAPLGFANVVRQGSIGLVGPSGTGIQEVACLIDQSGGGVSHAIGTGSHDLSSAVGGLTAAQGIRLLDADPETRVIAMIAKPASASDAQRLLDVCASASTPVVACFLGLNPEAVEAYGVTLAPTLEQAAHLAVGLAGGAVEETIATVTPPPPGPGYVRGLFSGGTLCAEAAMVLAQAGLRVESNVSMPGTAPLGDTDLTHRCLDLGADEFTIGRPHPMIDFRTRLDLIVREAGDPSVGVLLLDVVLGFGSHPDPAAELAPAIEQARTLAHREGRELVVVASVCGTERDPQVRSRQIQRLREAGVVVAASNVEAARLAIIACGERPASKRPAGFGVRRGSPLSEPATTNLVGDKPESGDPRRTPKPPTHVVSVGVDAFNGALVAQGIEVTQLEWRPPGSGDAGLAWALAELSGDAEIAAANERAVQRLIEARPMLMDLVPAREVWPSAGRRLLHAGPPIAWERMCGPMRGACIGAALFEGWAADEAEARALLERGEIMLEPCHHSQAVGPMAGVISPSMSLWMVRNESAGNLAYSNLNEGLGSVLRFGAYGAEVVERLRWMESVLAPTLRRALATRPDGFDLKSILAQALQMGDDGHNRNIAATSLLFRALTGPILESTSSIADAAATLRFIDSNNHFFLNLSMAAAKAGLDAAHGEPGSSLVTAMARNGVEFGIRVSGLGDQWFTAAAGVPEGLFFPGYSLADANPDMGDSAITETAGVGGFAMGTAPALVQFVGGSAEDALGYSREMMDITLARNAAYSLPALGFVGAPTGIDVRRVVDTGILPVINSGIAHREAGVGQIGAGIVRAPMGCFEAALSAMYAAIRRASK